MSEVLSGWQPDPYGVHEQRFFSDDGKPTRLVSDGGYKTHDVPPVAPTPSRTPASPAPIPPPVEGHEPPPTESNTPTLDSAPLSSQEMPRQVPNMMPVTREPMVQPAANQTVRARFLCRQCGGRHDQDDGVCPRCGVGAPQATATPTPSQAQQAGPESKQAQLELPAPGWYEDPVNAGQRRYWSGVAWTEHIA